MDIDRNNAWNQFLHTGRVEDYLQYAKVLHSAGTMGIGEDAPPDEDDNRWDSDRYAQYE